MSKGKITYRPQVDYFVLALATSLNDYRLSYFINESLTLTLNKIEDLVFIDKALNKTKNYSLSHAIDDDKNLEFFLVENKLPNNNIIKSLKNFDYLFIIKAIDNADTVDLEHYSAALKKLESIQLTHIADSLSKKELNTIAKLF